MDVKKWLISWFLKNTNADEEEIKKNFSEDYISIGWIDSLKFIEFIDACEKEFNIRFSNDEFQNREFATINGITKIIEEKLK